MKWLLALTNTTYQIYIDEYALIKGQVEMIYLKKNSIYIFFFFIFINYLLHINEYVCSIQYTSSNHIMHLHVL